MAHYTQISDVTAALGPTPGSLNETQANFYIGLVENTIRRRLSERGLTLEGLCQDQPYRALLVGIVATRVAAHLGPQLSGRTPGIESTTTSVDDGQVTLRWRTDAVEIADSLSAGDWDLLTPNSPAPTSSTRPVYAPDTCWP